MPEFLVLSCIESNYRRVLSQIEQFIATFACIYPILDWENLIKLLDLVPDR
ncbi:hypothetical protein AAKU67_003393 [Oxalobacteraceae bacterium GrIS 2.11]